jgi:hypothetical protein
LSKVNVIVLAAGKLEHNQVFVTDIESPLLVPYNGRPLMDSILESIPEASFIFVIPKNDWRTTSLLNKAKDKGICIEIVEINNSSVKNLASSLESGLRAHSFDANAGTFVLFGDGLYSFKNSNLIRKSNRPIVFAAPLSHVSNRYSFIKADEELNLIEFLPKNEDGQAQEDARVEVGCYFFPSGSKLSNLNFEKMSVTSISEIISLFKPVSVFEIDGWMDFGHWDLVNSYMNINSARSFNIISLNKNSQVLEKRSQDKKKLYAELQFLNSIPAKLSIYFPRAFAVENGYDIEYWPLKSISEFYVYWGLPEFVWKQIAKRCVWLLTEFENVKYEVEDNLNQFNVEKLRARLKEFPSWAMEIIQSESIIINEVNYELGVDYVSRIINFLLGIESKGPGTFTHGDFCFSNILYSPGTDLIKLIDPRGIFDSDETVTSIKYDLAKLMHSVHGRYDFIAQGFFQVKSLDKERYSLKIFERVDTERVWDIFLNNITESFPNIKISELLCIEASLFLSMIPLHKDSKERQLAFLLRGIQTIGEINEIMH